MCKYIGFKILSLFFTCCLCTPLLNHVGLHAKVVFHFMTCLVSFLYQLIRLCSLLYLLHLYIASKISSLLLFSPPLAHFLDPPLPILIRITKILFLCQHIYSEPLNKIQILFTKVKHLFHSDLQGFIVPTHLCSFNFSYRFFFFCQILFSCSRHRYISPIYSVILITKFNSQTTHIILHYQSPILYDLIYHSS